MDAAHILLWSLVALASLHLSVTMHHELKGHEYKIVQPIRLHAQNRKDTKSSETDRISYRLRIEGKNLDIHLKRSSRLISPNYTETHYTPNGTEVTSSPQHLDEQLCYYQGKVGNEQQSAVSMSTCNGLRGFFKAGEQSYIIEPLSESDTGDHAVFRYENLTVQGHYCGVTKQSWNPVLPHFNRKQRMDLMHGLSMKTQSVMEMDKYIEMYLVVDHSEFQKLQRDLSSVRLRMFEIINFVNMVYRPLNTFVALVGLEVWTNEDQIQIAPTASQTLSAFTHWRNTVLRKIRKHDNAQLISAVDFGTVVGMASVKSLCTMYSTALVRDYASSAALVGVVSAHELGHNLGMEHDVLPQCSCSPETCIMAPFLSAVPAQQFSSCSIEEYKQFLETYPGLQCLEDQPDESSLLSPPVCGNGFVEEGEQCDCGPVQNCTNPCCHAASCMFTVGSQCADGECCKNCKLLPFSRLCRSSVGECDLPEYCTGTSAECPEDVFKVNGLPCKNGTGYCYDGLCPRRQDQCTEIWGDHAEVAMKSCYDLNIEGTQNAYCKHPTPEEYIACQPKDVMCGKLFCSNGTDEPLFGRKVVNGSCKATNYSDPTADYGQVLTGTKCGEGLVCNNSECVSLRAVYGDPNCTCSGHAVCNNKRQCQCKPGWIPPNCDEMYKQYILYSQDLEYGLNKEAFIGGGLSVGIVVLAVFMFVIIRTIRSRHHSRPLATVISNYYQQTGQVYSIPINPAQLMAIMEDAERFSKNGLDTDSPR